MLVVEFDIGALRAEPQVPLVDAAREWIGGGVQVGGRGPAHRRARRATAAPGGLRGRLDPRDPVPYFAPSDPIGPLLCAGVMRSLAPQIVAQGIADEAELGLETLQERIAEQVVARDAVILPPAVVGAWGTRPGVD